MIIIPQGNPCGIFLFGPKEKTSEQRQKKRLFWSRYILYVSITLRKANSLIGANVCTCTTFGAEVWINLVDVALRNSLRWTFVNT